MVRNRTPKEPEAIELDEFEDEDEVEETVVIRPNDLAKELGLKDGKRIRAFLRQEFTRPSDAKNTNWELTEAQADAVRKRFAKKTEVDETEDAEDAA